MRVAELPDAPEDCRVLAAFSWTGRSLRRVNDSRIAATVLGSSGSTGSIRLVQVERASSTKASMTFESAISSTMVGMLSRERSGHARSQSAQSRKISKRYRLC